MGKGRTPQHFLLIFAGSQEELYQVAALIPGAATLGDNTGPLELRRVIAEQANGERPVVVATRRWAQGWRAPLNTLVMFAPGFPEDPALRDQANGRAAVLVGRRVA